MSQNGKDELLCVIMTEIPPCRWVIATCQCYKLFDRGRRTGRCITLNRISSDFTALHCMRSVILIVEPSACLSVCKSHASIVTKQMKAPPTILIPYERKFIYFFEHKEWLVGDAPLYLKFWVKLTYPASKRFKNGDFQSIFARSGSTLESSEKKSIITKRTSTQAFQ